FISEEIWQILNKDAGNIKVISESSLFEVKKGNAESIEKMKVLQDIIVNIRTLRSEMNISPAVKLEALFNVLEDNKETIAKENENYIKQLAKISTIQFCKNMKRPKNSALVVTGSFEIFLPLEGLIDAKKEKARLMKEIGFAKQEVDRITLNLDNENFIKKAPDTEIEKIKTRLNEAKLKIEKINETLNFLE
ncbi:MAG: hypothetical protein LBT07_00280, partial [Endomicrobium sp.]|nr:hypothetical protein [Endomicrobium sp.]